MIIEEMSTFLFFLLNKKREKKIDHFMMDKFKTFNKFIHDRTNITLIWVWFSKKVLNI